MRTARLLQQQRVMLLTVLGYAAAASGGGVRLRVYDCTYISSPLVHNWI